MKQVFSDLPWNKQSISSAQQSGERQLWHRRRKPVSQLQCGDQVWRKSSYVEQCTTLTPCLSHFLPGGWRDLTKLYVDVHPATVFSLIYDTDPVTSDFLEQLLLPAGRPAGWRVKVKSFQPVNSVLQTSRGNWSCWLEKPQEPPGEKPSVWNNVFLSPAPSLGPGSWINNKYINKDVLWNWVNSSWHIRSENHVVIIIRMC